MGDVRVDAVALVEPFVFGFTIWAIHQTMVGTHFIAALPLHDKGSGLDHLAADIVEGAWPEVEHAFDAVVVEELDADFS